jgi:hypothetical protein
MICTQSRTWRKCAGTPLTDEDRMPWLHKIAEELDSWCTRGESGVLTCPALKRSYRDIIIGDRPDVTLVYLGGSYDLIRRRMIARHEHFMPVALLDSQFATLQERTPDVGLAPIVPGPYQPGPAIEPRQIGGYRGRWSFAGGSGLPLHDELVVLVEPRWHVVEELPNQAVRLCGKSCARTPLRNHSDASNYPWLRQCLHASLQPG